MAAGARTVVQKMWYDEESALVDTVRREIFFSFFPESLVVCLVCKPYDMTLGVECRMYVHTVLYCTRKVGLLVVVFVG